MVRPYPIAIGGTLCLYLEVVDIDPATITPIIAKVKPALDETGEIPVGSVGAVGAASILFQPLSPGLNIDGTPIQPGFEVTIGGAVSAMMVPGFYVMDVAYTIAGAPFTTRRVVIEAVNAVSLP